MAGTASRDWWHKGCLCWPILASTTPGGSTRGPLGPDREASATVRVALPVALVVATLLVFAPTLDGDFLDWDDDVNFLTNPGFRGLGLAQLRWIATATLMGHYIPMTWLTLSANHAVGGMSPWGYHAVNVALHAANALVLYFIARRLLTAAAGASEPRASVACCWGGAAAAALFAVHPLRVESVAWITERRDVLSGLFFLMAVLAYLRAVEDPAPWFRWRALSTTCFAAGLLSKSSVLVLPAVLLLLDWCPLGRWRLGWRRVIREKAGYIALSAAGALVSMVALHYGMRVTSYSTYGFEARAAMVGYSLFFYPSRLVLPLHLSPLYELPTEVHLWQPRFLGPAIAVVLISAALVALRRRWPGGLAAWVCSAILVAPMSGIVHAGFQLAHDRYSYLSGMGFAVLAGGGLAVAIRARADGRLPAARAVLLYGGSAVALLMLAVSAVTQTGMWRNSEALWRGAVAADPRCGVCAGNLGALLARQGRYVEAEPLLRTAYHVRPARGRRNLGYALRNHGLDLAKQGQLVPATALLEEAVVLIPEDIDALRGLAVARWEQGQVGQAHAHLERSRALAPDDRVTAWLLERLQTDPSQPPVGNRGGSPSDTGGATRARPTQGS